MSTVFVGGSRKISRLSTEVKKRLENVVESEIRRSGRRRKWRR